MSTYDIAIVGGGPAGLSAALTAHARGKRAVVISNDFHDSPLAKSKLIENYPGLPKISGQHLLEVMHKQALEVGTAFVKARVLNVLPMGDHFTVTIANEEVDALTIILATGLVAGKKFDGEEQFLGHGVSYCATCDGMLYRGKDVVVVGLNTEAPAEANFLASIGCHVTYLAKPNSRQVVEDSVRLVHGTVQEIDGDKYGTTQVIFKSSAEEGYLHEGEAGTLLAKGVFILRPQIAPDSLLPGVELDGKLLKVDSGMSTSVKGVFAAGDCVAEPAQIAKAVGEGQLAAWNASRYIDNLAIA